MEHVVMTVPDISCEHCERTVASALSPIEGVANVKVDIPARQVELDIDRDLVSIDLLREVLAQEDYPVASIHEAG